MVLRADPRGDDDGVASSVIASLAQNTGATVTSTLDSQITLHVGEVGGETNDVHSKYLLVAARYGEGNEWETNVWTGSENWTGAALSSNDGIMLKFRDAEVHRQFVANHEMLKSKCRRVRGLYRP